ncbi:MAG: hypothetical protein AB7E42_05465 [Anaerotignaceae bacterium]
MYTKIINPRITIFDGDTDEFIGSANFTLTPESEQSLLQLVNYNIIPKSLILLNQKFYQQSTKFDPPTLDHPQYRKGILRIIVASAYGEQIPLEIRLRFDAIARGNLSGSQTFFDSVEYYNIGVDSKEEVSY